MTRTNGIRFDGEIVFTTSENSAALKRAIDRGEARRIARGIVTTNTRAPLETGRRRNWAPIAAHLVPGGTVVDRSFFDGGPASDGTVVLDVGPEGTATHAADHAPGLRIVTRSRAGTGA